MRIAPFSLPAGSSVLVTGAGGGLDFLCGLPIALELEALGHPGHAADYFPERLLCHWLRDRRGAERPVWCFPQVGVVGSAPPFHDRIDAAAAGRILSA